MCAATGDDPLHGRTPPELHWTTTNVGEGLPGVLTPLTWTTVGPAIDEAIRETAYAVGVFNRNERQSTDPPGANIFFGRVVIGMELLALLGDRMPGTSGREVLATLLGTIPPTFRFSPTRRRYAVIACKFPWVFARGPRAMRRMARDYDLWWRESTARVGALDEAGARALLIDAIARTRAAHALQGVGALVVVQPVYNAFERLIGWLARPELGELASVAGGPEMELVRDLWRASRNQLSLNDVIERHGYHGPREGELSSRSWREDPAPLRAAVQHYVARDESHGPDRERARVAQRHHALEREARKSLSPARQLALAAGLALVRRRLPLRGVVKCAMVQSLDVTRAAARRLGVHLAACGALDDAEDVFLLTAAELSGPVPSEARDLVAQRRQRRNEYELLTIPTAFQGEPQPSHRAACAPELFDQPSRLMGTGVSSGVAEGRARVITDPAVDEIEPDEILVASCTDPSWASVMFVSAALVVELGGPLSHAAVVAREMGIPCVVGVHSATTQVRTGDVIRVDGSRGTVEFVNRVAIAPLTTRGDNGEVRDRRPATQSEA